ncbi:hypothetical protein Pfo_018695 [Paulownia fortunei]|nr:hypothetical protein Pfo_018695 [Paulownia fortunei]
MHHLFLHRPQKQQVWLYTGPHTWTISLRSYKVGIFQRLMGIPEHATTVIRLLIGNAIDDFMANFACNPTNVPKQKRQKERLKKVEEERARSKEGRMVEKLVPENGKTSRNKKIHPDGFV